MADRLYRLWMRRLQEFLAAPPARLPDREGLNHATRAG
jgi:hypothetical protein